MERKGTSSPFSVSLLLFLTFLPQLLTTWYLPLTDSTNIQGMTVACQVTHREQGLEQ